MSKLKFVLITLFFLISSNLIVAQSLNSSNIKLKLISEIPKEFDGCLISYSLSKPELNKQQFILLDGWDGYKSQFCYIKINGVLERLELVKEKRLPQSSNYTNWYRNEVYTLTLIVEYLKPAGYDSYYTKATLVIEKNNNTNKTTFKLFGLCAC